MSRFFYILFGISYTVMIIYPICDESQDSKDSISNIVYEIFKSKNETFNAFNAITIKLIDASFDNKFDSISVSLSISFYSLIDKGKHISHTKDSTSHSIWIELLKI